MRVAAAPTLSREQILPAWPVERGPPANTRRSSLIIRGLARQVASACPAADIVCSATFWTTEDPKRPCTERSSEGMARARARRWKRMIGILGSEGRDVWEETGCNEPGAGRKQHCEIYTQYTRAQIGVSSIYDNKHRSRRMGVLCLGILF